MMVIMKMLIVVVAQQRCRRSTCAIVRAEVVASLSALAMLAMVPCAVAAACFMLPDHSAGEHPETPPR